MKNIIIIIILGLLGYYGFKYINPTRVQVLACIKNYETSVPFKSALEQVPRGEAGRSFCTQNYNSVNNFSNCLLETEKNAHVPTTTNFWFAYYRMFSTKLNTLEFLKRTHNEYCADTKNLIFR